MPPRRAAACGLALALAAFTPDVSAQSAKRYTVDRWTNADGLNNNDITNIRQTRDGYLWIGSFAGAVRFDGVRFTPIAEDLPNDHAVVLLEDADGAMWIGVSGFGLVKWRPTGVEHYSPAEGLSGRDVRAVAQDSDGRIWAVTENGVSVVDRKVVTSPRLDDRSGVTVVRAANGSVRVATAGEICESSAAELKCRTAIGIRGTITALLSDRAGNLWVGTKAGLFLNGELRIDGPVAALLEATDGGIWIGYHTGEVERIQGAARERYGAAEGLPSSGPVAFLYEDREHSVWIATSNGGLSRLKPKRVTMFTEADGLGGPVLGSIVQGPDGVIWTTTACQGTFSLQANRFVPRLPELIKQGCPRSLLFGRDGALWIGSRGGGLYRWDGTRLYQWDSKTGLSDDYVSALFEDRSGRIWIGTETGALHYYERAQLSRALREADGVATHHLASFAQSPDGRVWIGSNGNGLSIYENGKFRILSAEESPPTKNIAGLLIDSKGDLWIGSAADGLFRYRNGKYEPFGFAQGLGDRLVAVMIEDRDANLWVGTARGISRLERSRIDAVASGTATDLAPIILDRSDGMVNIEGSGGGFDPSGLRDHQGRLWFSTIDGIVVVDPSTFQINQLKPQIVVESASLDGAIVPGEADTIGVPPGTASIELAYTAFSLLAPAKVRFRYRLTGFDDHWQEVGGRRVAYFSRLSPGAYTFEVMATNNDGVWTDTPAAIRLEVQPFWWERGEARAAGLLLLLLVTGFAVNVAAHRRAQRRVEELEREQALTRERTRIARDLHDDLGSRLAQIALIAESGDSQDNHIAGVAREAMQTMDELVWTVNARNDTVESFAAYVAEFVEEHLTIAGLRFRLQIQPQLDGEMSADSRRHVFLAFKEAVHNVVKHAAATEVQVRLAVTDGTLVLEVADNGRGLPERERSGLGNGMRNMRERMVAAGGGLKVDSPAGGGTRIIFSMPLELAQGT